jgi:hypothetical protein
MTWSNVKLAETLDDWLLSERVIITETADDVVVGKLCADNTLSFLDALESLGWAHIIEDGTGSVVQRSGIEQDFAPYKVSARKPPGSSGRERVLTNAGMADWLSRPPSQSILEVCRLAARLETFSVLFAPWDDHASFTPERLEADPRKVVRESLASRSVPGELSQWILRPDQTIDFNNSAVLMWANRSSEQVAMSLSNEYEGSNVIVFKGPPIVRYRLDSSIATVIGPDRFADLQACARWVFMSEKEMETRHILMSAEFSRFNPGGDTVASLFKMASGPALEGARIAFELGVHKISADSLKALADLRKAVSDEASKLGDSTRQLAAAVSGALFGGIGLIVARLTISTTNVAVAAGVLLIGFVLCLYVAVTIASGRQFVAIQRDLREQWRDRLYRFIPEQEYGKLVTSPATRAEKAFNSASWISGILTAVLMMAVLCVSIPELWQSLQTWRMEKPAPVGQREPTSRAIDPLGVYTDKLIVGLPSSSP